ncbi:MAG TPA: hypothetical protein VHV32_00680 [Candidatus Angelobacter sp.]|jgi:hypothetical protein|nr:hypothetical protein [Candidatus Angelobacter sp.]
MIFGTLSIHPSEFIATINAKATEVVRSRDPEERNTAWTHAVKQALAAMGRDLGFEPFFSDPQNKRSEFMLDLVWWKQDQDGAWAALGVESEWGNPRVRDCKVRAGCVADDFEKLLQFKAPVKLLTFTADNNEMRRSIHDMLQRYLRQFCQHVAGEMYLFIEFSAGQCFSHICEIKRDGRDESLTLKPLNNESQRLLEVV